MEVKRRQIRVLVSGDNNFRDYDLMRSKLNNYLSKISEYRDMLIACGTNNGADMLARRYAAEKCYNLNAVKVDEAAYGPITDKIQRDAMIGDSKAIIIFWDGKNTETKKLIDLVNEYKLRMKVVLYAA